MILIGCVVGLILIAFLFFLIYHFRNEKSLQQTLLATRILATRGISNLKNVSANNLFNIKNLEDFFCNA